MKNPLSDELSQGPEWSAAERSVTAHQEEDFSIPPVSPAGGIPIPIYDTLPYHYCHGVETL